MPNSNSELYVLHAWEENPIYIKCVQGEGGIKIANFKLVDDNGVINLSSATSVTFDGIKRDGSGCCINCKIVDAANGIIEFVEQTGITDIDGNVNGTINVVFPDGNIKFDGITLYVAPNNTTKLIEASQAFSAFVEALNKLALITPEGTITLDDVLTNDGVNAVQGKVIKAELDTKADKETTLAGYGITDGENTKNKISDKSKITDEDANYPSIKYLDEYYYDYREVEDLLTGKADVKTTSQEIIDTLPKFMSLATVAATRAMYVDGQYLYHCGNSSYAVSKNDISVEVAPTQVKKIGGHAKVVTRGIAAGNGYLYVPYRDNVSGTGTTHGSDDDVGGYLDIINLSDFTLAKTITYGREPYDPDDGKGVRYYGKSHNAATYADKYLCVTQQLGGWLLYDIETTPENPTLLYKYDNRAQSVIDNTEFQQPAFYTDGTTVYLAIAGYDRHLLKIYNLKTPTYPISVYSGDLRTLWQYGDTAYLHAMGLVCKYPYIYCTVAPYPDYMADFDNTMQGVAVVDVSDINRVKINFYKIPNESRTANVGGEPSPQSVAITKNHLVMDMFDKGISVWSLANPAEPKFLGNLDTGATKVCSVLSTEDGRTFIGTEYQGGNLAMYRGL